MIGAGCAGFKWPNIIRWSARAWRLIALLAPSTRISLRDIPMIESAQDKQKEIAFFDGHAAMDGYDVFTPDSNLRLINACTRLGKWKRGARVADLGCGSGVFTSLLHRSGFDAVGIDLSPKLIALAQRTYPEAAFFEGDVEDLLFPSASLDGVLLSGLLHHLPDPARCAAEVFRV